MPAASKTAGAPTTVCYVSCDQATMWSGDGMTWLISWPSHAACVLLKVLRHKSVKTSCNRLGKIRSWKRPSQLRCPHRAWNTAADSITAMNIGRCGGSPSPGPPVSKSPLLNPAELRSSSSRQKVFRTGS